MRSEPFDDSAIERGASVRSSRDKSRSVVPESSDNCPKVIQTLTAIFWCALIIAHGIERDFHSFAHSSGARCSGRWANRGGLLHRLSRAAGEQMGCQHYRSAAGPECHLDWTLQHRPAPVVRCINFSIRSENRQTPSCV